MPWRYNAKHYNNLTKYILAPQFKSWTAIYMVHPGLYIRDIESKINHCWSGVFGADSMHFPLYVLGSFLFSCIHLLITWIVIWDSNRFTIGFSDNMVIMEYQFPEGRKSGSWIFCSPSMNLMINSLWFVNFKTRKLQSELPGSSWTKQEKQVHGNQICNLQTVWYNEKHFSSLWWSWVIPPYRCVLYMNEIENGVNTMEYVYLSWAFTMV